MGLKKLNFKSQLPLNKPQPVIVQLLPTKSSLLLEATAKGSMDCDTGLFSLIRAMSFGEFDLSDLSKNLGCCKESVETGKYLVY